MPDLSNMLNLLLEKLAGWWESFFLMLPNIGIALLVVIAFGLGSNFIRRMTFKGLNQISDNLAINRLLAKILQIGILMIGVFIALGVIQLRDTVMTLLAGLGIAGLALGFAFQDFAANLISGVMIAIYRPFRIGDLIEVDGQQGIVKKIKLRSTVLRLLSGQDLILPNKNLYQQALKNYSTGSRRVEIPVGVSYDDDLEQAEAIARKALENMDDIDRERGIEFYYTEFGDSSINFTVRFWIDFERQPDYLAARSEAIRRIKVAFDREGISIPFPIRTLDMSMADNKAVTAWMQNGKQKSLN